MGNLEIVDAVPEFLNYWEEAQNKPPAAQLAGWQHHAAARWPDLWQKLVDCYAEDDLDWQEVAMEYVVPYWSEQISDIVTAHDNLPAVIPEMFNRCRQTLGLKVDVVCVLYVGIGCGAGWVTSYDGRAAVLFGLENIAAEGWQSRETLRSLTAHELGHVAHFAWRDKAGVPQGKGPWWQLYSEGFAQWCEHLVMGRSSWHMQAAVGTPWQAWCEGHRGWLAAEYLRRVEQGEETQPFFGSWFDLQGYKQTGYFLGHEVIKQLAGRRHLQEIALLQDVPELFIPILQEMADTALA